MKKMVVFSVFLLFFLFKGDYLGANEKISFNVKDKKGCWSIIASKYGGSIASGVLIGSLCGLGCGGVEKAFNLNFSRVGAWIVFRLIRLKILDDLIIDAEEYNVPHHQPSIYNSAWIADWVTYLYYKNYQG